MIHFEFLPATATILCHGAAGREWRANGARHGRRRRARRAGHGGAQAQETAAHCSGHAAADGQRYIQTTVIPQPGLLRDESCHNPSAFAIGHDDDSRGVCPQPSTISPMQLAPTTTVGNDEGNITRAKQYFANILDYQCEYPPRPEIVTRSGDSREDPDPMGKHDLAFPIRTKCRECRSDVIVAKQDQEDTYLLPAFEDCIRERDQPTRSTVTTTPRCRSKHVLDAVAVQRCGSDGALNPISRADEAADARLGRAPAAANLMAWACHRRC
ncbi:hypothetical protein PHYSODRAFT_306656 [Phytophthora sojae]|uniref:Uncharacterized protein n=1 Tax=Phytophthora sojae (strain P6497) TaxID=1094619 RepID=G5AA58_PHYSP|nr:hypothetical protein PHYSODRAFT_306656 [Phytophthora sojae]EGZ07487.1 hypothetical protein PHYSODRAFT_306656 [Phytophthora sojae]|eukprot:XP_009537053.1 hypothetical protein PHYSODRAFT_306656 [Phytophthora sojae]